MPKIIPDTILDLGAYDGRASAPLVKEHDRWVIVDDLQWKQYGWGEPKIPDNAEYIVKDIFEYNDPAEIVVCSQVLYHVPEPIELLKHLRKLTKERLYLKTAFNEKPHPTMTYDGWTYYGLVNPVHPDKSTAATIYYRPTEEALLRALASVGFTVVKVNKLKIEKSIEVECI